MKGQLFKLFRRPTKRIVLSALHKAMYPGVNPLLISKDLLVHHKIRKITPLSPEFSDHIGYEVKGSGIFALNMMKRGMQRGERFNNAFSQLETPEQYTNRVIKMAHSIADEIEKNPDITKYLAQEAPIGENYQIFKEVIAQRLSDKWVCHNSDYGVLTMINTEKFAVTEISDDIQLTAGMDFARFRAFEITESGEDPYILINLHAPHDNQGDTLKVFIKNVIRELGNSERKVVICGDWNSTPQEINKSIQAAYTEIQDSLYATVGNKAITTSDVVAEIKTMLIFTGQKFNLSS